MISESSGCAKIAGELAALMHQKATGEWSIALSQSASPSQAQRRSHPPKGDRLPRRDSAIAPPTSSHNRDRGNSQTQTSLLNQQHWRFYFDGGRFLYAIDSTHRVRRWSRAMQQHCPDFSIDPKSIRDGEPWEYQLLQTAIADRILSVPTAKAILSSIGLEVLFEIANAPQVTTQWNSQLSGFDMPPHLALSCADVRAILQKAQHLWQQWQKMGLSYIDPDLAPVLSDPPRLQKQVSSASFLTLNNLFNGENTLWDLAIERKQSVISVTRTLHHFVEQGKIKLEKVPDLPSAIEQWRMIRAAVTPAKPLIACIDDSPVVAKALEQILRPAGYEAIAIHDPMQGVAILAEKKPDLIFLDLVMPHTNGYNLCTFLRQSSLFSNTPIIILTSHDGIIDRTRAKLIGASDFLSKPPHPEKVLQIVEKYLNTSSAKNSFSLPEYPAMA